MMDQTPADVLEEAADLLLIRGRCTGKGTYRGSYCALGAIAEVQGKNPNLWDEYIEDPAVTALATEVRPRATRSSTRPLGCYPTAPDVEVVWTWNDLFADDDFEVIDTLRSVAKDLRNEVAS